VSTTPESTHLNNSHRDTLSRLFQHPVSHNIEWHDVLSLLEAVGSVEERHDGKFVVTVGAETETLERPREKDIDVQQVIDLRRMLSNAGWAGGLGPVDSEDRQDQP
jgi:thiamine biosynthesis lipoprotein ApbE